MGQIVILKSGFLTTVQDRGRYGYQRFGMPVSGAMDLFSLQLANLLVGNELDAAVLEITLVGPEILFTDRRWIALCGGDLSPQVNGEEVKMYSLLSVEKGDRLSFGRLKSGCRAYLAISGGIDLPKVMNSSSTYLRAAIGGFAGRSLKAGDRVELGEIKTPPRKKEISTEAIPIYASRQKVRIVPGPEVRRLGKEGVFTLLTTTYQVSELSDRMGLRLQGKAIRLSPKAYEIVSAGVVMGTVQLTPNGLPIILMADRQTTGGYARIAVVATVDLTIVAQLKPGDELQFCEIGLEEAQAELLKHQLLLQTLAKN